MATTVVKTIGTGGDYSTLQAWEDACPANLVTADQVWQGQVKNQEFVSGSSLLTISGTTVDATRYVELTTEAGASFADHADKSTNALRYNASNGAGIRFTGTYSAAIIVSQSYTRLSKLQVASTGASASAAAIHSGTIDYLDYNQCIFEGKTAAHTVSLGGSNSIIRNSLVVARRSSSGKILFLDSGPDAYNCTAVSTAGVATNGIDGSFGTTTIKNCYVGNATNVTSGTSTFNKTTSFTSVSGPPTDWSAAAFSTATFESITDGTHDFRLKTGSALIDAGTTEATYAPDDIIGVARSTYDVGAHELAATDTTAPTLTSPGTSSIGSTTVTGDVTTDEANGTLYCLVTANATETAATVKATGTTQTITTTGAKSINITGLTASTLYYAHFVHTDAAANDSTVSNSASFTTDAAASTYAPNINKPRSGMGVNFYGAR